MAQQSRRIVRDDSLGGEARIAGRRISVLDVHEQVEERGLDAGTVADRFGLDVADVYRALAYYHDHPTEMRAVREERDAVVATARERSIRPGDVE